MRTERDLRNVIKILVQACVKYETRARGLNSTVTWIAGLPPNNRMALTPSHIQAAAADALEKAFPFADTRASRVIEALDGDKEFLETLRVYASQHFW